MDSSEALGSVKEFNGELNIKVKKFDSWNEAQSKAALYDQTTLKTGSRSDATIDLLGATITMDQNTLLRIKDPRKKNPYELDIGAVLFRTFGKKIIEIKVGQDFYAIEGTDATYKISTKNGKTTIKVLEGSVEVFKDKNRLNVNQGKMYLSEIEKNPQVLPITEVNLEAYSSYSQDSAFLRRPTLNFDKIPDNVSSKIYYRTNAQKWIEMDSSQFSPECCDRYEFRRFSTSSDGIEFESKSIFWTLSPEHFAKLPQTPELEPIQPQIIPLIKVTTTKKEKVRLKKKIRANFAKKEIFAPKIIASSPKIANSEFGSATPPPPQPLRLPSAESVFSIQPSPYGWTKKWKFEFGYGGNYALIKDTSAYSESNASGFSGPTLFLKLKKEVSSSTSLQFSFTNVRSNFKTSVNGDQYRNTLDWRSNLLGVEHKFSSFKPKIIGGVQFQESPLLYESVTGFDSSVLSTLNLYVGLRTQFDIGPKTRLIWEQRITNPMQEPRGSSQYTTNLKSGPATEGELTLMRCSERIGYGLSWLGQYQRYNFTTPPAGFLPRSDHSSEALNTNVQFRISYDDCNN